MCDTKLVSLRMPVDVLAEIDRLAVEEGRSRAQVIIRKCSHGKLEPKPETKPTKAVKQAAQPQPTLSTEKCSKPGHRVFPNGDGWFCMDC